MVAATNRDGHLLSQAGDRQRRLQRMRAVLGLQHPFWPFRHFASISRISTRLVLLLLLLLLDGLQTAVMQLGHWIANNKRDTKALTSQKRLDTCGWRPPCSGAGRISASYCYFARCFCCCHCKSNSNNMTLMLASLHKCYLASKASHRMSHSPVESGGSSNFLHGSICSVTFTQQVCSSNRSEPCALLLR